MLDDDALDQANYSYYVTFYDTSTGLESRPTNRIGALSSFRRESTHSHRQHSAAVGPDFNAVRIYRNIEGNPSQFLLVDTLDDGETTYIDNAPDAAIVGNPEIDLMGPKANAGTLLTRRRRCATTITIPRRFRKAC